MLSEKQKKIQDARNIDFNRWLNEDDLTEMQDRLKGLAVIQYALTDTQREGGGYTNINLAYDLVGETLSNIVKDIEALKPRLNYVDSFARVGTDELYRS